MIEQAEKKAEFKEYITTNSWKLMENALDGAKTVKNNPISQEAVDEACKLLENGLKMLKHMMENKNSIQKTVGNHSLMR